MRRRGTVRRARAGMVPALVEKKSAEAAFSVRVFFEATKTPVNDVFNTPDDLHLVFEPEGLHICDAPENGRRILYVFRKTRRGPLAVDLADLSVSIADKRIYDRHHSLDIPPAPWRPLRDIRLTTDSRKSISRIGKT